ncbi:MAG: hypothetical protein HLUCCA11_05085 [Phormidesmis priestleyi Ana]|uniref:Lipid-A-disaccharide synthase n=1 Tax=Phormidesmis priestleyi Ana TaxID=1666911 RepID=A0A0P7ZP49_9CYAN|nr:MAG: hypothetical protein HLUCCA11_05085 [Phormidesmis priestleyi Ana]
MKLLCISNGHGEDVIALRILKPLRQMQPDFAPDFAPHLESHLELSALPIAGTGEAYRAADVPIVGPVQAMPSGGFLNRSLKELARDMRQGLLSLTRSQITAIKAWAKTGDIVLAVGDIVPLLFAYLSGRPYIFVGTAKSEYWLRDERGKLPITQAFPASLCAQLEGWSGSVYLPWERWLMSRDRALALFVRDNLTAHQLQTLGIAAQCAGNPMMDGLTSTGQLTALLKPLRQLPPAPQIDAIAPNGTAKATALYVTPKQQLNPPLTLALLPGSRAPEAYQNWERILAAAPSLSHSFPYRPLILLAAIAPSLSLTQLQTRLSDWHPVPTARPYLTFTQGNLTLLIITDAYSDCLHEADLAIATAGTATEQFVGLGKLAITLPGPGPQFTESFATVQAKMLGPAVQIVYNPEEIGPTLTKILNDPDRLQLIYQTGKQRMGAPGAGSAIARQISQILKTLSSPIQNKT